MRLGCNCTNVFIFNIEVVNRKHLLMSVKAYFQVNVHLPISDELLILITQHSFEYCILQDMNHVTFLRPDALCI